MHFFKMSFSCAIVILWFSRRGSGVRVLPKLNNESWINKLEYIGPDGEIRPQIWNPAFRKWRNESSLGHLDPQGEIHQPMGRIIGGRNVMGGEVPYQVEIYMLKYGLWCGGSIYNKVTILSAGHCFYSGTKQLNESNFVFLMGKSNTKEREVSEMQRMATSIIVHPNYDTQNMIFDIAIIKLKTPLRYTYNIQPLPLGNPIEGGKAIISGWGYTRVIPNGGKYDKAGFGNFLKSTQIKIFTKSECVDLYGEVSLNLQELAKHENYLCAGVVEGGVDACSGDSGGPLACLNPKGEKYLCGIVSSGIGCGLPGHPGFYMNITVFKDWIESHAGKPDQAKRL